MWREFSEHFSLNGNSVHSAPSCAVLLWSSKSQGHFQEEEHTCPSTCQHENNMSCRLINWLCDSLLFSHASNVSITRVVCPLIALKPSTRGWILAEWHTSEVMHLQKAVVFVTAGQLRVARSPTWFRQEQKRQKIELKLICAIRTHHWVQRLLPIQVCWLQELWQYLSEPTGLGSVWDLYISIQSE